MISIDGSLFIQIGNFLLLIWVLNKILYRPIRNILSQRKEKFDGLTGDISTCSKHAQEKDEAFRMGLKEAREKGLRQKESLVQSAEEEEKKIINKINEKAQAELSRIKEQIARDAEAVKASLLREVDTFANDIGKKILGRAI